ncbi:hypothetical protein [Niallia taxi]|uniref:hypothetical protein n=1 Tax=Niallia taxi TaxID=2499688 RepID=UPI0015F69B9F|nr:hypothetical protein [Niallia taxi]
MLNRLNTYSFVVWDANSGDFMNALSYGVNEEIAEELFHLLYGDELKVIHKFLGDKPGITYRSLPYVK